MNDNTSRTRRSVLKSVGGATAGAAGLAGAVSASKDPLSDRERDDVLDSGKVSRVHEAVGHPEVTDSVKVTGRVGDDELTVYRFRTDVGELRYVDRNGEAVAQFIFGTTDGGVGTHTRVPSEYREALDADFASVYTDMQGGLAYIRDTTASEKRRLTAATDFSPDDAHMVFSSELDGYAVQERSDDGMGQTLAVTPTSRGSDSTSTGSLDEVTVREVAQANCDEDSCWNCVSGFLGGVVTCGGICVTVSWTIAGIVACVGCLIAAGVYVTWQCSKCYNTCG